MGGAAVVLASGVSLDHAQRPHGVAWRNVSVTLSPVLDLVASTSRLTATEFRASVATFAQRLVDQHLGSFDQVTQPLAYQHGVLSLSNYFFKIHKSLFRQRRQCYYSWAAGGCWCDGRLYRVEQVDPQRPVWLIGSARDFEALFSAQSIKSTLPLSRLCSELIYYLCIYYLLLCVCVCVCVFLYIYIYMFEIMYVCMHEWMNEENHEQRHNRSV